MKIKPQKPRIKVNWYQLDPTSPSNGVYIRADAGMSWDPDDQDDVVSYTFTPNDPITANWWFTGLVDQHKWLYINRWYRLHYHPTRTSQT